MAEQNYCTKTTNVIYPLVNSSIHGINSTYSLFLDPRFLFPVTKIKSLFDKYKLKLDRMFNAQSESAFRSIDTCIREYMRRIEYKI